MSEASRHFRLGLYVIGGTIVAIVAVIAFGAGSFFEEVVLMETYIDESVQGLEVGSPIRYRGVQVGTVRRVGFVREAYPPPTLDDPETRRIGAQVRVVMAVRREFFSSYTDEEIASVVHDAISDGLRVVLTSSGITGVSYLEVDYETVRAEPPPKQFAWWEPETIYVPSAPSTISRLTTSVEHFFAELEGVDLVAIGQRLESILASVDRNLEGTDVPRIQEELVALLEDTRDTVGHFRALVAGDELGSAVGDVRSAAAGARRMVDDAEGRVDSLLAELEVSMGSLRGTLAEVERAAASAELEGTFGDLRATSRNAAAASEELAPLFLEARATLERLDLLLSRQQGDLDVLAANLREVSENLRRITSEARAYPSLILFGEPPARADPDD